MFKKVLCAPLFGVVMVLLMGVDGCDKKQALAPVCDVAKQSIQGAALGISEVLACSNPTAVAIDLVEPLYKLNLCEREMQAGTFGDLICPQVSGFVMNFGVTALPKAWGCTGGNVKDQIGKALEDTCKKYVSF